MWGVIEAEGVRGTGQEKCSSPGHFAAIHQGGQESRQPVKTNLVVWERVEL